MKIFLDAMGPLPYISIGGQALMEGAMEILRHKFNDAIFTFFCKYPEHERIYLEKTDFNIEIVKRSHNQLIAAFQARSLAKKSDLVVSAWGDGYITFPPHLMYRKVRFIKAKKTPLALFTSSVGPFESSGFKRWLAKSALEKYDYLSVRDTITRQYMSDLGFDNVDLIPDTAYALKPCLPSRIAEILECEGIPKSDPFVGFNLGMQFMHYCEKNGFDFVDICIQVIEHFRNKYNCNVVLIPHQSLLDGYDYSNIPGYTYDRRDDRYTIDKVWDALSLHDNVYRLNKVYTCSELKGVIGRSQVFVCNRIHPSVASVTQCVPTAILHYTHKAKGMMELLGKGEYVWYPKQISTVKTEDPSMDGLHKMIDRLWEQRNEYKAHLNNIMPDMVKDVYSLGDKVADVMS